MSKKKIVDETSGEVFDTEQPMPVNQIIHKKWKTQFNAHAFPPTYEINKMPSQTIPDQTMSVREIMERHSNGLGYTGIKVPMYYGEEEEIPELDKMDLSERYEYIRLNRIRIADMQNQLQSEEYERQRPKPSPIEEAEVVEEKPKK